MRVLLSLLLALAPALALAAGPSAPTNVAVSVAGTTATITWTPPTKNTDGAAVTVAGYNIYMAATDADLTATANTAPKVAGGVLNPGSLAKYVMTGLAPGTYWLDMTSWFCPGTGSCAPVSPFSNHVTFTIGTTAATGSAQLSWTAPTKNDDGSALANPVAYNVYEGASPTTVTVKLTPATVTGLAYAALGLAPGTWYFDVTAVDTVTGKESAPSGVVSTTIAVMTTPGAPAQPTIACSVPAGSNLTCSLSPGH